jgi:type IV pilus assembly protein PilA
MSKLFRSPADSKKGFTLIEILVVMGIIAVLAAIVIIAINPARQFAQARNTQRQSGINTILNGIGQCLADNKGIFEKCPGGIGNCPMMSVPMVRTSIYTATSAGNIDLSCLVPTYMPSFPLDPTLSNTTGDTGYDVSVATSGRITVYAPGAIEPAIPGSVEIFVER